MQERRKRQKREQQSNTLKIELSRDDKYEMKDYDLQVYKETVAMDDYMRVCLAKMGYHIVQSSQTYEEAFW